MSDSYYQRLTQLDHSFLIYEGPNSPMHVGATQIFEAAPLRRPEGGLDIERIEQYVQSRLHAIPRYRQRLSRTPIEGHPIWIDDPRFNIRYHVRHTRLPRPGDERLLKRAVGRIFSQHLDRGKPLWEMWVIEGLGDRVAIVSKIHHCMVDGDPGVDLPAACSPRSHSRVSKRRTCGCRDRLRAPRSSRSKKPSAWSRRRSTPHPRFSTSRATRITRANGSPRASARSAASWPAAALRRARRSINPSAPTGAWTGWRWTAPSASRSSSVAR
jgi:WS/DGAT/MGAT family acyltransferase